MTTTTPARSVSSHTGGYSVSRVDGAQHQQQHQHHQQQRPLSCNRCQKPLSTTLFVCACDCVFCEECTYSHFHKNTNCPVCDRTLGANDFTELVVADPSTMSSSAQDTMKSTLQTLFTKCSSTSNAVSHYEMCQRLLQSLDNDKRVARFLLKQFVMDSKNSGKQLYTVQRAYQKLQQEHTKVQQSVSSERMQSERIRNDLQNRVTALSGTIQEMKQQLHEKEQLIVQFRQMYEKDGLERLPQSQHHTSSNHSVTTTSSTTQHHPERHHQHQHPLHSMHPPPLQHHEYPHSVVLRPLDNNINGRTQPVPPMPSFLEQKRNQERIKAHSVAIMSRSRVVPPGQRNQPLPTEPLPPQYIIGGISDDIHSIMTPIPVPPNNHSTMHQSPRIRTLAAGSGYHFSIRSRSDPTTRTNQTMGHCVPSSTPSRNTFGGKNSCTRSVSSNNSSNGRMVHPQHQQQQYHPTKKNYL